MNHCSRSHPLQRLACKTRASSTSFLMMSSFFMQSDYFIFHSDINLSYKIRIIDSVWRFSSYMLCKMMSCYFD